MRNQTVEASNLGLPTAASTMVEIETTNARIITIFALRPSILIFSDRNTKPLKAATLKPRAGFRITIQSTQPMGIPTSGHMTSFFLMMETG